MKVNNAIKKKRCFVILHMPMQQNACFLKHSVHTVPEDPTLVHAHACPPPPLHNQSLRRKQKHPDLFCRMKTWALRETR